MLTFTGRSWFSRARMKASRSSAVIEANPSRTRIFHSSELAESLRDSDMRPTRGKALVFNVVPILFPLLVYPSVSSLVHPRPRLVDDSSDFLLKLGLSCGFFKCC